MLRPERPQGHEGDERDQRAASEPTGQEPEDRHRYRQEREREEGQAPARRADLQRSATPRLGIGPPDEAGQEGGFGDRTDTRQQDRDREDRGEPGRQVVTGASPGGALPFCPPSRNPGVC